MSCSVVLVTSHLHIHIMNISRVQAEKSSNCYVELTITLLSCFKSDFFNIINRDFNLDETFPNIDLICNIFHCILLYLVRYFLFSCVRLTCVLALFWSDDLILAVFKGMQHLWICYALIPDMKILLECLLCIHVCSAMRWKATRKNIYATFNVCIFYNVTFYCFFHLINRRVSACFPYQCINESMCKSRFTS